MTGIVVQGGILLLGTTTIFSSYHQSSMLLHWCTTIADNAGWDNPGCDVVDTKGLFTIWRWDEGNVTSVLIVASVNLWTNHLQRASLNDSWHWIEKKFYLSVMNSSYLQSDCSKTSCGFELGPALRPPPAFFNRIATARTLLNAEFFLFSFLL